MVIIPASDETKKELFMVADPIINKNCSLEEVKRVALSEGVRRVNGAIHTYVVMSDYEYAEFSENLLADYDWLAVLPVGNNSTADIGRDVDSLLMMTEREIDIWRSGCFEILTAIVHDGAVKFYVNAQGYNYARYTMLGIGEQSVTKKAGE